MLVAGAGTAQGRAVDPTLAARFTQEMIAAKHCLDTLPPTAMRRAAARLVVRAEATRDTAVAFAIGFLAEDIGAALRTRLAGNDSTLGAADSLLHWLELESVAIGLALGPSGFAWSVDDGTPPGAVRMLTPLLDSLVANPPMIAWPETSRQRAVRARLTFVVPHFDAEGRPVVVGIGPVDIGPAVFTLMHPWHTPTMVPAGGLAGISYPEFARRNRLTGQLRIGFVVGRDGRAIPGTIRDVQRPTFAAGDDDLAEGYDRFRQTVVAAIERQRFIPTVKGGCAVPSLEAQVFGFGVTGN